MNDSETVTRILDVAQDLAQKRGYNAFSYRGLGMDAATEAAALEGAMIVARAFGSIEHFTRTSTLLLASLEAK